MDTNCAPLVAELFYTATKEISWILLTMYLDDILNTDSPYFEGMVNQIYQPELQMNKFNTTDTEANF